MGVSKNRGGPPKSSILVGFSIINHPFWGFSPIFGSTPIYKIRVFFSQRFLPATGGDQSHSSGRFAICCVESLGPSLVWRWEHSDFLTENMCEVQMWWNYLVVPCFWLELEIDRCRKNDNVLVPCWDITCFFGPPKPNLAKDRSPPFFFWVLDCQRRVRSSWNHLLTWPMAKL